LNAAKRALFYACTLDHRERKGFMIKRRWENFNKGVSSSFILLLVLAQLPDLYGGQNGQNSADAAPKKLNIVIVEGDGAINNVQQRVAREVIVQVDDENHKPLSGALVTFALPTGGPGGNFAGGANVFSAVTDASGRVTTSFTPNNLAGSFKLNINASFQGQTTSTSISQSNASGSATNTAARGSSGGGISATTTALIVAAAAAAVTVGVIATRKGSNSNSTPTIGIGRGTPTLGAPGGFAQSGLQSGSTPKWRD
jgi:hypothetical protein